jgi:hypothetical protein
MPEEDLKPKQGGNKINSTTLTLIIIMFYLITLFNITSRILFTVEIAKKTIKNNQATKFLKHLD